MIAVAFPGQGAQYVGMAGELDQMRLEYFARASDLLGYDLLELCQKGPIEQLSNTRYAQPAIMVACISHWAALTQNGRRVLGTVLRTNRTMPPALLVSTMEY